ncbi:MAG: glycosyltransferase family 2 protein [Actinomycetota bacterium]|nr:glycosyltransferase family 2 protein [Actinomycetota bacterium]
MNQLGTEHSFSNSVSVAMCTFNGARFLLEQLNSIAAQTRPPDELVVSDDGSTDDTVAIVETFSRKAAFPVRLFVNERRLGSTKNFEKTISLCRAGLIALADQDDLWHPEKLAVQEWALRSRAVGGVFSDAEAIGPEGQPLGYRLWESVGFWRHEQALVQAGKATPLLLRQKFVTGATLMFRTDYRSAALPIPENWIHDAWIALVVAALGGLTFSERPLVQYRQHSNNQIGAARPVRGIAALLAPLARARRWNAEISEELAQYQVAVGRFRRMLPFGLEPTLIPELEQKVTHLQERVDLPRATLRRVPIVLKGLGSGRYHRYSAGLRSAAKDLVVRS